MKSQYIGALTDQMLQESLCSDCNGSCGTCFLKEKENKGEISMSMLDKQIDEAFVKPYERPQAEEELNFTTVYQIKDGNLAQTERNKIDGKVYWEDVKAQKKEKAIEESDNLSDDDKILAAFK